MSDHSAWIAACLQPCLTSPCGEDPRYTDAFEQLQMEIEKLEGCNYETIIQISKQLLTQQAKDLRVAGFLCLALFQVLQVSGLIAGLQLYAELLEQYGYGIYPISVRGRIAAIHWLNNSRLKALLANHPPTPEQQQTITQYLQTIHHAIENRLELPSVSMTVFDGWLQQVYQPPIEEAEKIAPAAIPSPAVQAIDFEKQAATFEHQLILFYHQEKQWLKACQLARALRWNNLVIELNAQGKTNIQSPRKEALHSLEQQTKQDDPESVLEFCECLFLEPGGLFWLDLQWHAKEAALQLGETALADYLFTISLWVCQTHPALLKARFASDLPFANETTKLWLLPKNESTDSAQEPFTAAQILKECRHADLPKTLACISTYPLPNAQSHLLKTQAKAQACLRFKREDLACIFYQELTETIDKQHFADWFPEQALLIWREIMNFLNRPSHQANHQAWIQTLQRKICLSNSELASQWI